MGVTFETPKHSSASSRRGLDTGRKLIPLFHFIKMSENRQHAVPFEILDEIAARFIINIPPEERKDLVRVCFQVEAAHWFYMDFYVSSEENMRLPPHLRLQQGTMKEVAAHMFNHVPYLQKHAARVEEIVEEWREYKLGVPTFGAIIINEGGDKVLLAQSWGRPNWGFPKGKVNEDELPHLCAAREVLEETGFDITPLLDEEEFVEQVINDQTVRLYIITGVSEATVFKTQTRCEIRAIRWFSLHLLPTNKSDQTTKAKLGTTANNFFMVFPFLRSIKNWIKNRRKEGKMRRKKNSENRTKNSSESSEDMMMDLRGNLENEDPERRLRSLCQRQSENVKHVLRDKNNSSQISVVKNAQISDVKNSQIKLFVDDRSEDGSAEETKTNDDNSGVFVKTFDETYCPEAWTNFKLTQEEILKALLGVTSS